MTRKVLAGVLLVMGLGLIVHASWIPAKAALGQVLLERAWERIQGGASGDGSDSHGRPWPWADTEPVARLQAPELGTSVLVLAGVSGRTLAWGPGHVPGTALPGAPGNSVVSGHRDTHFAFLEDLKPGDPLEVETPDGSVRFYRVSGAEVVHERSRRPLAPLRAERGQEPPRVLTLVTCYPFDAIRPGGPLRYVVRAEAVTGRPDRRRPRP